MAGAAPRMESTKALAASAGGEVQTRNGPANNSYFLLG